MDVLVKYWPFLILLVLAELVLAITALVHVLKHPYYRFWSKPVWVLIVLLVQIIGPIAYFVFGRGEEA